MLGATYDHDDFREEVDQSQQEELLSRLYEQVPSLAEDNLEVLSGRVSFRSMSPDRMAHVGRVVIKEGF